MTGHGPSLLDLSAWPFRDTRSERMAIAVSGGGDSMALLDLARQHGAAMRVAVQAVTLDHGLRPEAEDEVALVAAYCAAQKIPHHVLRWIWDGRGNLQEAAREARYKLIAEWARAAGVDAVALGHTQDDVAETFLMRLSRAAGVDGLAAMEGDFTRHGMRWVRPLLGLSRQALRDYLGARGLAWAEDPSNSDLRFDRVKARRALQQLGIDAETIATSAVHLAATRQALDEITAQEAARAVELEGGDVLLAASERRAWEITRRLFLAALRFVSGATYAPRESAVTFATGELLSQRATTLAGCYCEVARRGERVFWRIGREYNAVRGAVCPTDGLWDGRWQLEGPHDEGLEIRALGEAVRGTNWRDTGLPRAALMASPAVWSGNDLVAAPVAGQGNGWRATLIQGRDDFAASLIRR